MIVLLAPHQDETKQGKRFNHATWLLVGPGPLSRGCNQQDLHRQSFLGHFGRVGVASRTCVANLSWDILVTWPKHCSRDLSIMMRYGSTVRALRISQLHILSRSMPRRELVTKILSLLLVPER